MKKLDYLNLGCGTKVHPAWTNLDLAARSPHVQACNLLEGIPFPERSFSVVYHSQVLEHIPKARALYFVQECLRVLKPGGMLRVVVPDLENIAREYLKHLDENLRNTQPMSQANYDWILLEMYDQAVRNTSGGQMAEYLRQPEVVNEAYVLERTGHVGRRIRADYMANQDQVPPPSPSKPKRKRGILKRIKRALKEIGQEAPAPQAVSEAERIGTFRLGGEIHMWMYDRHSLARLLRQAGFDEPKQRTPFESAIPDWDKYELDVKDGAVFDPSSLFMEARKPT